MSQPKLICLVTTEDIATAVFRLDLKDMMEDIVDLTHDHAKEYPDLPHLVAAIGGNENETLLLACLSASGLVADFGILANTKLTPTLRQRLLAEAQETGQEAVRRMIGEGACLCDDCIARMNELGPNG
jgi:hypothetical protein